MSLWNNYAFVRAYNNDRSVYRVQTVFPDIWRCFYKEYLKRDLNKVLDYGCGGALLFKYCPPEMRDVQLVGHDISSVMIEAAVRTCRRINHPNISFVDSLTKCPPNSFDAVSCIAVWTHWSSNHECINNLRSIRRVLQKDGIAFFAIQNPRHWDQDPDYDCRFDMNYYSSFGLPFDIVRRGAKNERGKGVIFHWPVEKMVDQLREAGFCGFIEIFNYPPAPKTTHSPWIRITARHI